MYIHTHTCSSNGTQPARFHILHTDHRPSTIHHPPTSLSFPHSHLTGPGPLPGIGVGHGYGHGPLRRERETRAHSLGLAWLCSAQLRTMHAQLHFAMTIRAPPYFVIIQVAVMYACMYVCTGTYYHAKCIHCITVWHVCIQCYHCMALHDARGTRWTGRKTDR